MKRFVVTRTNSSIISLSEVPDTTPIFAERRGKLVGMLVQYDEGWLLNIGGRLGATGYHKTRQQCIESCFRHDYEFFIEDNG